MIDVKIEPSWKELLQDEFDKPYFADLIQFVKQEYQTTRVFPPGRLIFNAFNHCPVDSTRVVILGQDPYHGPGQAQGLCFSVPEGIEQPPSLQNIFKEIHDDVGSPIPSSGNLERWAAYAQRKGAFIDTSRHLVLKSAHPSPLSANRGGWFGNHHFSKTNAYLRANGLPEIKW